VNRFLRGSPLAAAWEFATGDDVHDNISGEEMMKALGVQDPGFLVSTLGAIALGPSTYIGLGALTKLGKAFRAGQIYVAGSGVAEAAEGIMQITRGEELVRFGTKEAIKAAGGEIGAKFPLSRLNLGEQASLGVRGIGFGVHNWMAFAPKNLNIPVYSAVETMIEGLSRSALGQAVRPIFSVLPVIGKGFSSANDTTIATSRVAGDLLKTELYQREGLAAGYRAMIERGFGAIVEKTPEELRKLVPVFKELGLDTIDVTRDPEFIASAFAQRMAKLFGFSGEEESKALAEGLVGKLTGGPVADEDAVKLAQETIGKVFHAIGLTEDPAEVAGAFEKVWNANKDIHESYVTVRDLSRVKNITEPVPTDLKALADFVERHSLTKEEEKAFKNYINFRRSTIDTFDAQHDAAFKAAQKLGLFRDDLYAFDKASALNEAAANTGALGIGKPPTGATVLDRAAVDAHFATFNQLGTMTDKQKRAFEKIYDYLNTASDILGEETTLNADGVFSKAGSFGEAAIGKMEEVAASFSELNQNARETILHGGQGYRTMVERVAQNIRQGSEAVDNWKSLASQTIDPKAKDALKVAFDKVSKTLTKKGADIAGAPVETQIVYDTLKRGAEATTYSDLVAAGLWSVEQMNDFHLTAENAAGVATMMNEAYMAHVTTKEGRDFINATFKKAVMSGAGGGGNSFFTKGRELTDFTIGEANQVFREVGMRSTGDTPSKIMNEMGEFLNDTFRKVDPEFMEKLRKVDPNAAAVFEADAVSIQLRRAEASAASIAKANFNRAIFETHGNGGIATRTWDIGTAATHATTAAEMERAIASGHVIVNVGDILKPSEIRPRDILSESGVMRAQGVSDATRFMMQSDVEAIDEVLTKTKGVQEFLPGTGLMKEGERYAAIDRNLYAEVMRTNALATSPLYMGRVMRFMHKATNYWKMWTLNNPISTFSFNARNVVGDLFLSAIGGMGPREGFEAYKDMTRLMKAAAGLGENGLLDLKIVVGDKAYTGADLLSMMKQHGVIGHGAHVMDSMAAAEISAAKRTANTVRDWVPGFSGERNKWLKPGNALTEQASSVTRGAFFLDQLRKGATPIEAARATKKYLLDYSSNLLTHTERGALKLAIPFYTFMRRSIPAVLEGLVTSSSKFSTMEKFIRNFGERTDQLHAVKELPDTLVPDYIQEMYGVPHKVDENGNPQYFLLKSWIPGGDIAELAEAARNIATGKGGKKLLGSITQRINPLAKVAVEQLANYSFFTGKPIEAFDGQTQEMFGSPWSARTAYMLRQVRFLNELDRLNPVAAVDRTGESGSRGEPEYADRWLGFLSGIKPTHVDIPTERARSEFDIERSIRETKSQIKRISRNFNDPGQKEQIEALQKTLRSHYSDLVKLNMGFSEFRKAVGVDQ